MNRGERIAELAWEAFGKWCYEHDPDRELSQFEQVVAYDKWCEEQRVLKTAIGTEK